MTDELYDYFGGNASKKVEPIEDDDFDLEDEAPAEATAQQKDGAEPEATGAEISGTPDEVEPVAAESGDEPATEKKKSSHWDFLANMLGISGSGKGEKAEPTQAEPTQAEPTQAEPTQAAETKQVVEPAAKATPSTQPKQKTPPRKTPAAQADSKKQGKSASPEKVDFFGFEPVPSPEEDTPLPSMFAKSPPSESGDLLAPLADDPNELIGWEPVAPARPTAEQDQSKTAKPAAAAPATPQSQREQASAAKAPEPAAVKPRQPDYIADADDEELDEDDFVEFEIEELDVSPIREEEAKKHGRRSRRRPSHTKAVEAETEVVSDRDQDSVDQFGDEELSEPEVTKASNDDSREKRPRRRRRGRGRKPRADEGADQRFESEDDGGPEFVDEPLGFVDDFDDDSVEEVTAKTAEDDDAPRGRRPRRRRRGRDRGDSDSTTESRSSESRSSESRSSESRSSGRAESERDTVESRSTERGERQSRSRSGRGPDKSDDSGRRGGRRPDGESRAPAKTVAAQSGFGAGLLDDLDDELDDLDSPDDVVDVAESDDRQERPPRKRRRRRGGKSRSEREPKAKTDDEFDDDDNFDDDDAAAYDNVYRSEPTESGYVDEDDEPVTKSRNRGRGRGESRDINEDKQRARVPTWDEAITVLIDSNLENHKRTGGNQRRGGGRGRGSSGSDNRGKDNRGNDNRGSNDGRGRRR